MGGMGSGYYGNGGGKAAVEHCRKIDIRVLQRKKLLNGPSFSLEWSNMRGEAIASIGVILKEEYLLLSYTANGERIRTELYCDETEAGFGIRKWFLCPDCGSRVAVLYLKGKYFACRKCHNLNYLSSQLSGDTDYYHRQLAKICTVLKADYDPTSSFPPWKPKRMHWRTYQKHAKRFRQLAIKRDQLFLAGAQRILSR